MLVNNGQFPKSNFGTEPQLLVRHKSNSDAVHQLVISQKQKRPGFSTMLYMVSTNNMLNGTQCY